MDWVMRDKKTKEVVSVLSQSWSSKGTRITYAGKDGQRHEVSDRTFNGQFEQVDFDMSSLVPYILEAYKFDGVIRRTLDPLARKCFPNYYNVGDMVFLVNIDEDIDNVFNHHIHYSENQYYSELRTGFKITDIIDRSSLEAGLYQIELALGESNDKIFVPFYKTRLLAKDASFYLKRFDKEY